MINRYTKLRLKKRFRNQKKFIETAGEQAGDQFEKKVLGRWRNLSSVKRFVVGWLALVLLLIIGVFIQMQELKPYYLTDTPIAGGTFREGIVGQISNLNPIFATSTADRAAAKLIFNSLLTYDGEGNLIGELATDYNINKDGTIYTVNLRRDVTWHDGEPFTADDVVFTYKSIQHPDTRSYLNSTWRDVKVQKKSDYSVTFALPNQFVPFPHLLAESGIIPKHILGELDPSQLRGQAFNTDAPIGTGPFRFVELLIDTNELGAKGQLRLSANENYFKRPVKLDKFIISTYLDRELMLADFMDGNLSSAGGLITTDRRQLFDSLDNKWYDLPLNNIVFVFFNTSQGELKSATVRQALSYSINQVPIHELVDNRFPVLDSPILPSHLGYTEKTVQVNFDANKAGQLLSKDGWRLNPDKKDDRFRYKNGKRLHIQLITQNSDDFPNVASEIAKQWTAVGVETEVTVIDESDIQQSHISPHNYEALIFGLSMGADPDSFAYWHSSQSGVNGFNLSEVEDDTIDDALESGRTRSDVKLREAKYYSFLESWVDLSPAYALYKPAYGYAQRINVAGFEAHELNTPEQRFNNVENWQVNIGQGNIPY